MSLQSLTANFENFRELLKLPLNILVFFPLFFTIYLCPILSFSQNNTKTYTESIIKSDSGTVTLSKPPVPGDSALSVKKNALPDSLKQPPKRDIETTINYAAEDSIIMDAENKNAFLYNKAHVIYGSRDIQASVIQVDYKTNIITADHTNDSTGKRIGTPVFKEAGTVYVAKGIKYNYKSKKGLVKELVTQQGEGYVHGNTVKKDPRNFMYLDHAKYTTCNLPHPHFYIKATKLKMIPNKKIVTGPFHMVIADIPTPLAFFFGYFPLPKRRSSGIIVPSYGESADRGFYLRSGGYYWAVNEYIGAQFTADLYTIGGWAGRVNLDYKKKYAYSGQLQLAFTHYIYNPDDNKLRSSQNNMQINWQHKPELKGKSYSFSASVTYGSTSFNSHTSYNPTTLTTANYNSSVTFSKTFRNSPFSAALAARADQSISSGVSTFQLPTGNIAMNRIYPFKNIPLPRRIADPIKKINFSYNGTFENVLTNIISHTYPGYDVLGRNGNIYTSGDSSYYDKSDTIKLLGSTGPEGFTSELNRFVSQAKYGVNHTIPVTTTIKFLKFFSLNPSFNYNEYWYQHSFIYHDWTPTTKAVKIDTLGFGRAYTYSLSASVTTRVYGTFFIRRWGMEALRHTLIPTIGFSYTPDLSGQSYQKNVRINDTAYMNLNRFDNSIYGTPNTNLSRNITFSLANTFELKSRDKKDTSKVSYKKTMILDNVGLSGSYNTVPDSFRLSQIGLTARTKLLKIFDINFLSTIDPYYYRVDSIKYNGREAITRTSSYAWQHGQGLGKMTNASLSISSSFRPGKNNSKNKPISPPAYIEPWELQYIRQNSANYLDWKVPWSLTISYIFNYSTYLDKNTPTSPDINNTFVNTYSNIFRFSGDLSLSSKWKITGSTGYDLTARNFNITQLGIVRDLHCWNINFFWIPFGPSQSYNVNIAVKSSTLRDLKLTRNRNYTDN